MSVSAEMLMRFFSKNQLAAMISLVRRPNDIKEAYKLYLNYCKILGLDPFEFYNYLENLKIIELGGVFILSKGSILRMKKLLIDKSIIEEIAEELKLKK